MLTVPILPEPVGFLAVEPGPVVLRTEPIVVADFGTRAVAMDLIELSEMAEAVVWAWVPVVGKGKPEQAQERVPPVGGMADRWVAILVSVMAWPLILRP